MQREHPGGAPRTKLERLTGHGGGWTLEATLDYGPGRQGHPRDPLLRRALRGAEGASEMDEGRRLTRAIGVQAGGGQAFAMTRSSSRRRAGSAMSSMAVIFSALVVKRKTTRSCPATIQTAAAAPSRSAGVAPRARRANGATSAAPW